MTLTPEQMGEVFSVVMHQLEVSRTWRMAESLTIDESMILWSFFVDLRSRRHDPPE